MNRRLAFIAACALWLAVPHAQAQSDMKLRMDAGPYIGAGVGRMEQRDFCASINGGFCDAKDLSWNLFAGYRFNRHIAAEVGYVDFGKATVNGFTTGGGVPASVAQKSKAFELVGVFGVPLNEAFSIYGKLGFFRYDSDGAGTGAFVGANSSDKGTELTFGAGVEWAFYQNFGARLEWQRYMDVGSGVVNKGDINLFRFATRYKF